MITSATVKDLPEILNIYENARTFMAENGNPAQWANGYPQKELLLRDIERKQLYLCRDASSVYGVFAFVIGDDPTYARIENGAWLSDAPYGTIHRIAGNTGIKSSQANSSRASGPRSGNFLSAGCTSPGGFCHTGNEVSCMTKKGVFAEALSYCESKISHLRIDTHRDNHIMQHLVEKHGFHKCGTIYVADGSPRIAYEKMKLPSPHSFFHTTDIIVK